MSGCRQYTIKQQQKGRYFLQRNMKTRRGQFYLEISAKMKSEIEDNLSRTESKGAFSENKKFRDQS